MKLVAVDQGLGDLLFQLLIMLAAGHLAYSLIKFIRPRLAHYWRHSAMRERAVASKAKLRNGFRMLTVKRGFSQSCQLALPLSPCLGALLLNRMAWHSGYRANALGLLGCHFLSFFLLLLAGCMAIVVFKGAVKSEQSTPAGGPRLLDVGVLVLSFSGCVGWYAVWPFILILLTSFLLIALLSSRMSATSPGEGWPRRPAVTRAGLAVLAFTVTWYLCASTTRQALHGLGERIEAKGGSDRLLFWAKEVIAVHGQRPQPPGVEREAMPAFVDDLLGPFQGVRSAGVSLDNPDKPCVDLYTGGSAYHFRIRVCPSRDKQKPPPWWVGELDGLEWRPGISLATEGK